MSNAYPFFHDVIPDMSYGYCPLHALYALLARLAGQSVLWLWFYLPVILVPLVLGVNYYFSRLITQSRFVALLSVLLLIYFLGFVGLPFMGFSTLAYPRNIALFIIIPLLWVLIIQTLRIYNIRTMALFVPAFMLLVLIHPLSGIHFVIAYIVFAIIVVVLRGGQKSPWYGRMFYLLTLMIMVMGLYTIFVPVGIIRNPVHLGFRRQEIVELGGRLSIAIPGIFLFQGGPITTHGPSTPFPLFSYLLLPGLFLSPRRNSLGKEYLFAMGLLLPLTIFNPLMFPFMRRVLTIEGSVLILQVVPYHLIFPYSLYLIVQSILTDTYQSLRSRKNRYFITGAISVLIIIVLSIYVFRSVPAKGRLFKTKQQMLDLDPRYEVADYLLKNSRVDKDRFAADFESSYVVGALTNIDVLGLPRTMSSPSHPFILSRNLDIYRFFSVIPRKVRLKLARLYGITYVMLDFSRINPRVAERIRNEFNADPAIYNFLRDFRGLLLYRIDPDAVGKALLEEEG
jgi:hypothetical protein